MKRISILIGMVTVFNLNTKCQCTVLMDDTLWIGCPNVTTPTTYSTSVWGLPQVLDYSNWTFSWSPTTGLDDPHDQTPWVTVSQGYKTYTLTCTAPGCGTFVAGHTVVAAFPVIVSPKGPINIYNQYENDDSLKLTVTLDNHQVDAVWYKNDTMIPGPYYQKTLQIPYTGNSNYTSTYKVNYNGCYNTATQSNRYSNIVSFNYHGIQNDVGYPVSITHGGCISAMTSPNYIQLNAPSLGTGTVYNYWLQNNPTCYTISGAGHLTASSCSPGVMNGVYVKSSLNGAETFMYYTIGVNLGCRTFSQLPQTSLNEQIADKKTAIIFPNPANQQVTVSSKLSIDKIEIINSLGVTVKKIFANKENSLRISIKDLMPGFYQCIIYSGSSKENLKLIVQ